jgi:general secretion pathway protein D
MRRFFTELKRWPGWLIAVLFILSAMAAHEQKASAQLTVENGHLFFGPELVEFAELTQTVAEFCKVNVITSDKVSGKGKMFILAPDGLSPDEAWWLYMHTVDLMGATFTATGKYTRLDNDSNMPSLPSNVYIQDLPDWDKKSPHVVFIYRMAHMSAEDAIKVLDPLRSKTGKLYAFQDKLIFIEYQELLPRLLDILGAIDVGDSRTRVYFWKAQYSPIEDVTQIIEQLFMPKGNEKGSVIGLDTMVTDERTNGVFIVGTEDAAQRVLAFLPKLDLPLTQTMEMDVVFLKFATAETVAQVLQGVTKGSSSTRTSGQRQFGEDLQVDVTADKQTNSVLLVGPPRGIASLKKVIEQLDRFPRQVFLEVVIMEVTVKNDFNAGLATVGAAKTPGDSTLIGGTNYGSLNAVTIDPTSLMGLAMGVRGPELEGSGDAYNLGFNFPKFGALIRLLESTGNVNIVANPYLMGMDAEEAEVIVGSNVPFITGTAMDNFNQPVLSIQRQDVALTVKLKPEINERGSVKLAVDIQIEDLTSISELLGPTTTKRAIKTVVMTQNGSRIALGGLIKTKELEDTEKVPVLGDIPVLGRLFRTTKKTGEKTNLMAVITPYIIESQDDLKRVFKRKLNERSAYIREMYGEENDNYGIPQDYHDRVGTVEMIRKLVAEQKARKEAGEAEQMIVITPDSTNSGSSDTQDVEALDADGMPALEPGDIVIVPRGAAPPPEETEAESPAPAQ